MTADLHILHVFPTFKIGGAQVRFAELAKGFDNRFSHTVIAMDGSYAAAQFLPPDVDIKLGGVPAAGGSLMGRLSRYRRDLAAQAPDLLITYNWGSIEWALANLTMGRPHIHIEDGFGPEEADRQLPRRVWTRRLALRRSQVIVPSLTLQHMALHVWRLDSARVHYIPNGIAPCDDFSTPIAALGLDLPRDLPRIAWAGAVRREKNLTRLLRAFTPLKREAVLIIIGDGPELDGVRRESETLALGPAIRFLGRRQDVRDIFMQCDLMALSSDTEQMPLAVLEAMDAGLPIASTDVGDVRHMVSQENRPYIVNGSDRELGAALGALVMDPAARKGIGTANRRRLRRDFQAKSMIAAYEALFRRTAGAGNRKRKGGP
jgi:glycosyltransferase involved in cell wall biosynthesis